MSAFQIRLLSLFLMVTLLFSLSGCSENPEADEDKITLSEGDATLPVDSDTDNLSSEEMEEDSAFPLVGHVGEYLFEDYAEEMEQAEDTYRLREVGYTRKTRSAEEPLEEITAPRYRLWSDGVYRTTEDAEEEGQAVLMLTGDLMCQVLQQKAAKESYGEYDFRDNFSIVKNIFSSADLVIGNLEACVAEHSTYTLEEQYVEDMPHCNAPSTFLDALRYAGFDMLMTANNHCMDCGLEGIYRTLCHLDEYGFMHTGTFRESDRERGILCEVNGIKIGFLSYTCLFNYLHETLTTAGQETFLNAYTAKKVAQDVADLKSRGAEYIIAYNHWGKEYSNEVRDVQVERAQAMADAGVDYIIGSHPHALQKYDTLTVSDGRTVPVIYSMGNFSTMSKFDISRETMILRLELERDENGKIVLANQGYLPGRVLTKNQGRNYLITPTIGKWREGITDSLLDEAYQHITQVIGSKLPLWDGE